MDLLERMADELARKTLEIEQASGDDTIADQVAKSIGTSSTTLQEAYMTALRIRRAAQRGGETLQQLSEKAMKKAKTFDFDVGDRHDPWEEV